MRKRLRFLWISLATCAIFLAALGIFAIPFAKSWLGQKIDKIVSEKTSWQSHTQVRKMTWKKIILDTQIPAAQIEINGLEVDLGALELRSRSGELHLFLSQLKLPKPAPQDLPETFSLDLKATLKAERVESLHYTLTSNDDALFQARAVGNFSLETRSGHLEWQVSDEGKAHDWIQKQIPIGVEYSKLHAQGKMDFQLKSSGPEWQSNLLIESPDLRLSPLPPILSIRSLRSSVFGHAQEIQLKAGEVKAEIAGKKLSPFRFDVKIPRPKPKEAKVNFRWRQNFSKSGLQPADFMPSLKSKGLSAQGWVEIQSQVPLQDMWQHRSKMRADFDSLRYGESSAEGLKLAATAQGRAIESLTAEAMSLGQADKIYMLKLSSTSFERISRRLQGTFSAQWLGGSLTSSNILFDFKKLQSSAVVALKSIRLKFLLKALKAEKLSGDGKLSGELPFAWSQAESWSLNQAYLENQEPGRLEYKEGAGSGTTKVENLAELSKLLGAGGQALVFKALENFHYDYLRLELSRSQKAPMRARATLKGRNPDLIRGQAFVINVPFEGDIEKLIEQSVLRGLVDPDYWRENKSSEAKP